MIFHLSQNMVNLRIGSQNCRGLASNQVKRRDLFNLYREKYDITFLIDTHSLEPACTYWISEWGYKAHFTSYSSNSGGVGILFKNSFEYEVRRELKDENGNYIILEIKCFDKILILAAIYGPNEDKPGFFDNIFNLIETFGNDNIIIGGDFNVPLDYSLDTKLYKNRNNPKSREKILDKISHLDLVDIWRETHENEHRFTWHGPNGKQARLDYFLLTTDLCPYVTHNDIGYAYKSDHSMIDVFFKFIDQERGKGSWKFNNSLLHDEEYINIIKQCIADTLSQYEVSNDDGIITYSIDDQLLWEMLKLNIRGKTISYSSFKKRNRDKREQTLENKLLNLYKKDMNLQETKEEIATEQLKMNYT